MKARNLMLLAGALAAPQLATSARAQEQGDRVNEIIITASRREALLRDTPAAVSALTGDALEDRGVVDIASLNGLAPGLTVLNGGASNLRLAIRGIQGIGEGTVGLYYDEVAVSGSVGASNDAGGSAPGLALFDVERIEVLRGPQGTLYGSNAMAGAVKVLFAKPSFSTEAAGQIDVYHRAGGELGERASALLNLPLVDERLALRLVGFQDSGGGYIDSSARQAKNLNDARRWAGRVLLRWTPRQDLTIDAAVHYQDNRGDLPSWVLEAGDYQDDAQARRTNLDKQEIYSLTGRWDLGAVVVTGLASHSHRRIDQFNTDASAFFTTYLNNAAMCARLRGGGAPCSPETMATFNSYVASFIPNVIQPRQATDNDSFELRASSKTAAPLAWTVGVFHAERDGEVTNVQMDVDPANGQVIEGRAPRFIRQISEQLRQTAVFADLGWQASERLRLEAGARRFRYERQSAGQTPLGLDLINAPATPYARYDASETGWVSRFNASYRIAPGALVFGQASKGYRPGGVNQVLGLPDALVAYRSDHVWTYEAGARLEGLAGRADLQASAFRSDWSNLQALGSRPDGLFRFTANAGAAEISGVELEARIRPARGLSLTGALTALDAALSEHQINAAVVAAGRKNDRIPYIPKTTATVAARYERPIAGLTGSIQLDLSYSGASYSEFRPTNAFYRRIPSSVLTNLRVGVESQDGRWSMLAYVDNLFDEIALSTATANAVTLGRTQVTSAPPRTLGLVVRRRL